MTNCRSGGSRQRHAAGPTFPLFDLGQLPRCVEVTTSDLSLWERCWSPFAVLPILPQTDPPRTLSNRAETYAPRSNTPRQFAARRCLFARCVRRHATGDITPVVWSWPLWASSRFPRSAERGDPCERHITSYSDRRNSITPLSSR